MKYPVCILQSRLVLPTKLWGKFAVLGQQVGVWAEGPIWFHAASALPGLQKLAQAMEAALNCTVAVRTE